MKKRGSKVQSVLQCGLEAYSGFKDPVNQKCIP